MHDWATMYTELPSKQLKVSVPDKNIFICNEDETRLVSPEKVQLDLDVAVSYVPSGRVFIRPSGTEDVVRIYAEAAGRAEADALAITAMNIINNHLPYSQQS